MHEQNNRKTENEFKLNSEARNSKTTRNFCRRLFKTFWYVIRKKT